MQNEYKHIYATVVRTLSELELIQKYNMKQEFYIYIVYFISISNILTMKVEDQIKAPKTH